MDENGRERYAHGADLEPKGDVDPAAVGAAVTVALCGHWEHEGPCRWPNFHETTPSAGIWRYRALFVAPPAEEPEVRSRIEAALRGNARWAVRWSGPRPVAPEEQEHAERLARTPLRVD